MQTNGVDGEKVLSLPEIRVEIDRIDAQLVALLAERARYVEMAGHHKPTASQVRVPERERQILERTAQLATEHGIDPSFVEQLYQFMLNYFVSSEQDQVRQRTGGEE